MRGQVRGMVLALEAPGADVCGATLRAAGVDADVCNAAGREDPAHGARRGDVDGDGATELLFGSILGKVSVFKVRCRLPHTLH